MNIENDTNNVDDFAADMAAFDEEFDAASGEQEFGDIPDGKYKAVIASSQMKMSKKNRPMWVLSFAIDGGKYHGRRLFKNQLLDNAMGAKITKQDVTTLGVDIGKFSNLANCMEMFLDKSVTIQQKTKGEYTNLYINECHGMSDGGIPTAGSGDGTGAGASTQDIDFGDADDIPF